MLFETLGDDIQMLAGHVADLRRGSLGVKSIS
jgi:hypothetical protein